MPLVHLDEDADLSHNEAEFHNHRCAAGVLPPTTRARMLDDPSLDATGCTICDVKEDS
jgi:hypothetical protein